jgi:hypothetical protein
VLLKIEHYFSAQIYVPRAILIKNYWSVSGRFELLSATLFTIDHSLFTTNPKMNRTTLTLLRPMILVFILLNAFFLVGKDWLLKKGIDQEVLIAGNLILFIVTLVTFLITYRSLKAGNPNVFVRAMYAGFIIKFFVIAITAFVYIMAVKKNVNKPALFTCMGLYVVYTVLEIGSLFRILKQKKNA